MTYTRRAGGPAGGGQAPASAGVGCRRRRAGLRPGGRPGRRGRSLVAAGGAEPGEHIGSRGQLLPADGRCEGVHGRGAAAQHQNAEDALKAAHAEILTQRTRTGELLGYIRDLEAEWTEEAIQRITAENTTLKQRVRQLTADNRTLEERLQAARSNLRFQDRRVADLEARLADGPDVDTRR